jgi:predicted metalloenzyme YecM
MTKLHEVLDDVDIFVATVLREVSQAGYDLDDFVQIDHVCYRVPSLERYSEKKAEFALVGKLISEKRVNGRDIATFRLKEPIRHGHWRIDCLELPEPKEGSRYVEGLEHAEFVIYDDFETFTKKYPNDNYEFKAATRSMNPDIGLDLQSCSVKFHLYSLAAAVHIEDVLAVKEVKDGQ